MALPAPSTLPKPSRLGHYRKAEELIEDADKHHDLAVNEKDPKKAEGLLAHIDRLVARAHVHAVLSSVDRTVAQ